jgi:hypothetical protein
MNLFTSFTELKKLFESGEFDGGGIWGSYPPAKKSTGNTATLDKPSLITLSLTGEEISTILSSLDSIPNSGNLIAKLKQSLI